MMDPENPMIPLPEGVEEHKLPFPKLDEYDYEVAHLLASIYNLSREAVGRNLTDNERMGLDTVVEEMIQCVNVFGQKAKKLESPHCSMQILSARPSAKP